MAKLQHDLGIALILCFGLLTTLGICRLIKPEDTTLRLVSALFRHGDRTVDTEHNESFPTDPYKDYNYYPDGGGQLTNDGKKRVYQLGQTLRNKYNRFLGNLYYQPNVYAHSTMVARAKMTLQLVLAALYPPADVQKWNPLLPWQPIDFTYFYDAQDILMFPILCPVYIRLYKEMQQTPEIKTKVAEFADLMKEVSNYTGNNIKTTFNLFFVYNTLVAETYYGLRLPQWTQGIFPNGKLLDATLFQFDLFSYGKLKSKNGGVLLRKVINDMDGVINGTLKDRKINLFSGHDINMAALLYALNIFDYQTPKFSSSVIIELHEKDGQFFVKVLHYLGVPPKMVEKIIPGCEILCPYDKFVLLTSESTATDEEMECPEKMILRFDF